MKPIILYVLFVLFLTTNIFSQIPQKKEMQKAKTDTIPKVMVAKTVLPKTNIVKTPATTNTSKPTVLETQKSNSAITAAPITGKKTKIIVINEKRIPIPPDLSKASLLDAFVSVSTGYTNPAVIMLSNYNKDPDTHWSCGIFDQNERPITSFHDDSNTDEYPENSTAGPLKMHIDNTAVFDDFSTDGHIHINIAPNGNDTWSITNFTLTLDFINPNITQKLTWTNIELSQDKRDIDLSFYYDGKNLVTRQ